jgi:hypothetical protein
MGTHRHSKRLPFIKYYELGADLNGPESGVMQRKLADRMLAIGEFRWVRAGVIKRAERRPVVVGQTSHGRGPGTPGVQLLAI